MYLELLETSLAMMATSDSNVDGYSRGGRSLCVYRNGVGRIGKRNVAAVENSYPALDNISCSLT